MKPISHPIETIEANNLLGLIDRTAPETVHQRPTPTEKIKTVPGPRPDTENRMPTITGGQAPLPEWQT